MGWALKANGGYLMQPRLEFANYFSTIAHYIAQLIHPPRKAFQGTHKLPYTELCGIIPIPF